MEYYLAVYLIGVFLTFVYLLVFVKKNNELQKSFSLYHVLAVCTFSLLFPLFWFLMFLYISANLIVYFVKGKP